MGILDEIKTSAPAAVGALSVIALLFLIVVLLAIYIRASNDAYDKRWQSKQGIPSKLQTGKSGTFYLALSVGLVVLIALSGFVGWKVIDGLVGDSPESSTVQTETSEER